MTESSAATHFDHLRALGICPPADCPRCEYMQIEHESLHCYMFRDKPGPTCGQFKLDRSATPTQEPDHD